MKLVWSCSCGEKKKKKKLLCLFLKRPLSSVHLLPKQPSSICDQEATITPEASQTDQYGCKYVDASHSWSIIVSYPRNTFALFYPHGAERPLSIMTVERLLFSFLIYLHPCNCLTRSLSVVFKCRWLLTPWRCKVSSRLDDEHWTLLLFLCLISNSAHTAKLWKVSTHA